MKTLIEQIEDFRAHASTASAHVPMTGKLITELSKSIDCDKPNADGEADPRCLAIRRTLNMIGNRNRVVLVGRAVVDLLATQLPAAATPTPAPVDNKPAETKPKSETAKK